MERFCILWLCFISLVICLPPASHATEADPQSVDQYLNSLGKKPTSMELYDFLDAYTSAFSQCKNTGTYLQTLSLLADNGEKGAVRSHLAQLEKCPDLSQSVALWAGHLSLRVGAENTFSETAKLHSTSTQATSQKTEHASTSIKVTAISEVTPHVSPHTPIINTKPAARPELKEVTNSRSTSEPKKQKRNTPVKTSDVPAPLLRTALTKMPPPALVQTQPVPKKVDATTDIPTHTVRFYTQNFYKDGDSSTSRLYRNENGVDAEVYENLHLDLKAIYMTSFQGKKERETGSSFLTEKKHTLQTEYTTFAPTISYMFNNLTFKLGSSPIGADIAPLPTARVVYANGPISLGAFHDVVTESLLSYVGFKDIYTGKKMGRVMQAGGKASWQDTFFEKWFYGVAGTGAHLYGENVKDNNAFKGEAFIGRSFGEFAAGIYSSVDRFEHNLNNFTFGHGGYYSPQLAATAAGFMSWEFRREGLYLKVDTSLGHLYEKIDSAQHYYLTSEAGSPFKSSYANKFITNIGLETAFALLKNTDLGFSTRLLTSGTFFEGRGGIELKVHF